MSTNAYGSMEDVAALVPRWTSSGIFTESTRPTLETVNNWLEQISAILNAKLSELGFAVPITDEKILPMLNVFVNVEVSAMVEGVNGSGKFGPRAGSAGGGSRWTMLIGDVNSFLEEIAVGLERSGAVRTDSETSGIGFKETDDAGEEIYPLFQRKAFGDDAYQINWDQ